MTDPDRDEGGGRSRRPTYALVLVLHALVIAALWAFGRSFGS